MIRLKNTILLVIILLAVSCSNYQKVLKNADPRIKYEAAIKYYEGKDYFKALQLLDELVSVYRGSENAEKIYYMYAKCYMEQDDYVMASYHFNQFYKIFPNSQYAEECLYLSAYCQYLDSPVYTLDQTSTYMAIEQMQLFINTFPNSQRVIEANNMMDEMRQKLELKAYYIAKLYYKRNDYNAAIVMLKNLLRDYPETKRREEINYYIAMASYDYAMKSIESKKQERLLNSENLCKTYINQYPNGRYIKDIQTIILNISNINKK